MSTAYDSSMDQGLAAHREGRLNDALTAYQSALAATPDDAQASSLAGVALMQMDRLADAEPLLRHAVEREPYQFNFQFNLASLLEKRGLLELAAVHIGRALEIKRDSPRAWEKLGDLQVGLNRLSSAGDAYSESLMIDGRHFDTTIKLARVCVAQKEFEGATNMLRRAAALKPNDEQIFEVESKMPASLRNWAGLEQLSRSWVQRNPNSYRGWKTLATAAFELGHFRQSMSAYRTAIDLRAPNAEELGKYAAIALRAQDVETAKAALAEAEALDANQASVLSAKATLLTYLGKFEEAEACCRKVLEQEPHNIAAFTLLSTLKNGKLSDSDIGALSSVANSNGQEPETRILAMFAIANALDAKGGIDGAFAEYQKAQTLRRQSNATQSIGYSHPLATARTKKIASLFPKAAGRGANVTGPRPIFIVGMPRSGTTLVESILAAHSKVRTLGERPRMQQILEARLAMAERGIQPSETDLENWARAYYVDVEGEADVVTDKFPLNFESAGMIQLLFPDAVILHVRRDPVETGLSIFRHQFPKFWTFANRLEDIGHYYGEYATLAAHWEQTLGERFVTVQYEDLVADFDAGARRIVEAAGLAWEEACANFQDTERAVTTFSAVQVREPLKDQNGRAALYAAHLKPLKDALEEANVDLTTGALKA